MLKNRRRPCPRAPRRAVDCAGVDTRAGVTPARARGGRRPALPGPDRTGPEGPGRGWGARGEDKATEGPPARAARKRGWSCPASCCGFPLGGVQGPPRPGPPRIRLRAGQGQHARECETGWRLSTGLASPDPSALVQLLANRLRPSGRAFGTEVGAEAVGGGSRGCPGAAPGARLLGVQVFLCEVGVRLHELLEVGWRDTGTLVRSVGGQGLQSGVSPGAPHTRGRLGIYVHA